MDTMVQPPPMLRPEDSLTPTASHFNIPPRPEPASSPSMQTPTRDSFHSSEKRPLPDESVPERPSLAPPSTTSNISRAGSQRSGVSSENQDVTMTGEEGEEPEESDTEAILEDGQPAKKKRSQRFFCTDYPPCQLSFTRSEHLARHIRKHTGERPFQCHCLRRFSRLDNLRQHAQTVHVNEEIPGDSLAATGTRFQRQVRTDRIRSSGPRQRTSTMSSGGSQSRGHSRNMSTSSIGSVSDFGSPEDVRRRPQSLAMAQTTPPRPGLSLDTYGPQMGPAPYYNYSPSGYSTPGSLMSADASSPRMSSALGSPIAMMPRSSIAWGGQNHSRRLSVPSSVNAFHSPHAYPSPPGPFMSPPPPAPATPYSNAGSVYTSPTGSNFGDARHESIDAVEAEWRRRTWHPSTRNSMSRPATSGLSYQQRPDDPQPVSTTQPAAQQAVRLPGIDSFDRAHMQPAAPFRRSQGDIDMEEVPQPVEQEPPGKRDSWNSISSNLNHLELIQSSPSDDNGVRRLEPATQPGAMVSPGMSPQATMSTPRAVPVPLNLSHNNDIPSMPIEVPTTPRNRKRQGWYMGPLTAGGSSDVDEKPPPGTAVRTSPESSSNSDELRTPSMNNAAEYHPAIMHSNGVIEGGQPGTVVEDAKTLVQPQPDQSVMAPTNPSSSTTRPATTTDQQAVRRSVGDTDRLDALVAVATSEDRAMS